MGSVHDATHARQTADPIRLIARRQSGMGAIGVIIDFHAETVGIVGYSNRPHLSKRLTAQPKATPPTSPRSSSPVETHTGTIRHGCCLSPQRRCQSRSMSKRASCPRRDIHQRWCISLGQQPSDLPPARTIGRHKCPVDTNLGDDGKLPVKKYQWPIASSPRWDGQFLKEIFESFSRATR